MKKFTAPEIEVTKFAVADVLTTSGDVIYGFQDASSCTPIG